MKIILCSVFVIVALISVAQESSFVITGRILAPNSEPVPNAYIINYRSLAVYATRSNGQFTIRAEKGDSMVVNHISFTRLIVYADSIMLHPNIYLEYDTVLIGQVDFGPDPNKEDEYLQETMESIRNMDVKIYKRMNPEISPVNQTVTENNIVFRSQASSIHIVSFSPTAVVSEIFKGDKKLVRQKGFKFYRNEKQKLRKEKRNK